MATDKNKQPTDAELLADIPAQLPPDRTTVANNTLDRLCDIIGEHRATIEDLHAKERSLDTDFYGAIEADDGIIIPIQSVQHFRMKPDTSRNVFAITATTANDTTFTVGTSESREEANEFVRAMVTDIYGPIYKPGLPDIAYRERVRDTNPDPPPSPPPYIDPRQMDGRLPADYVPGTDPGYRTEAPAEILTA